MKKIAKFFCSFEHRTAIFGLISFAFNLSYGIYLFSASALSFSLLRTLLAAYYVFFAFLRGGVLVHYKRRIDGKENELFELVSYRRTGLLLVLSSIIILGIGVGVSFVIKKAPFLNYALWVTVGYTVVRIIAAVVGTVRAVGHNEPIIKALRGISLVDMISSLTAIYGELAVSPMLKIDRGTWLFLPTSLCLFAVFVGAYMTFDAIDGIKKSTADK